MKKIVGLGNSLVDVLVSLNDDKMLAELGLPKGSMQLINVSGKQSVERAMKGLEVVKAPGGSAANTIKALAHLGTTTGFIGQVGQDDNGRFFKDSLRAIGVNADLTIALEGATGVAHTFVSADGERTFATFLGVSGDLRAQDVAPSRLQGYDMLYVEGYMAQNHELIEHVMRQASDKGIKICLDLASYNVVEANKELFGNLLREYVNIVFANEEESRAFTGHNAEKALEELASICDVAVVKLGARGAIVRRGDEQVYGAAQRIEHVVDTTGAGDFFAAGFLHSYINGESLDRCLENGGRMAAEVIQKMGTSI